jgi:hypothetical protein
MNIFLRLVIIKRGFSGNFSELVSNFKETNKKVIIVKHSEQLLKDFENLQRIQYIESPD